MFEVTGVESFALIISRFLSCLPATRPPPHAAAHQKRPSAADKCVEEGGGGGSRSGGEQGAWGVGAAAAVNARQKDADALEEDDEDKDEEDEHEHEHEEEALPSSEAVAELLALARKQTVAPRCAVLVMASLALAAESRCVLTGTKVQILTGALLVQTCW